MKVLRISQGLGMLVSAAQSTLILIFAALYLGYLSLPTLIVILIILALLLPLVIGRGEAIRGPLATAANKDAQFFEGFTGILRGFKELKLNRPDNDDLFANIRENTDTAYELKMEVNTYQSPALSR
jgi:putative ATP-binding cassette transporter